MVGTSDASIYDHYSELATVEANWDTHTLGRYDVGANVFSMVAEKTGDQVRPWTGPPAIENVYLNASYPGIFNSKTYAPVSNELTNCVLVVDLVDLYIHVTTLLFGESFY